MTNKNIKEAKRILVKYLKDNKKSFPPGIRAKHFSLIEMRYENNWIYYQFYGCLPGKAEHKYLINIELSFEYLTYLVSALHFIGTKKTYKIDSCTPIKTMSYGGIIERNKKS